MKWVFIIFGSAAFGAVANACGLGWVDSNGFNIYGAIVNQLGVFAIVVAANGIWR